MLWFPPGLAGKLKKALGWLGWSFWPVTDGYFKRLQQAHRHAAGSCQPALQDTTQRNRLLGSAVAAVTGLASLVHTTWHVIGPALGWCGQGLVPQQPLQFFCPLKNECSSARIPLITRGATADSMPWRAKCALP